MSEKTMKLQLKAGAPDEVRVRIGVELDRTFKKKDAPFQVDKKVGKAILRTYEDFTEVKETPKKKRRSSKSSKTKAKAVKTPKTAKTAAISGKTKTQPSSAGTVTSGDAAATDKAEPVENGIQTAKEATE